MHRPNAYQEKIASVVRAEMASQFKTGTGLAEAIGLSQPTVARRLRGEYPFDVGQLDAVAKWLGTTASEIANRAELITPEKVAS